MVSKKYGELVLNIKTEYPDAERLGQLDSPLARQVGDLFAHMIDMQVCCDVLQCLGSMFGDIDKENNRQHFQVVSSAWHGVLIRFYKCFDSSARIALSENKMFKDAGAKNNFKFFLNFRNKHVAHDENPFIQIKVMAIINVKGSAQDVANTYNLQAVSETFSNSWLEAVWQLSSFAQNWIKVELEKKEKLLLKEVRSLNRQDLDLLPLPQFIVPQNSQMGSRR